MKSKTFIKLIEDVQSNIIIRDYNSCSYVSKILLTDYLNDFKRSSKDSEKKFYFNEIKRILNESFNLTLKINYNQIEF